MIPGCARILACSLTLVRASPPLTKRDDSRPSVSASIWTPTVVIFVVFVGLAALGCVGRAVLRHSRATQIANATAIANRPGTSTNPADQLISAINADVAGSGNANPSRRARRPRRPRRTPSQVSVTSLPEYMKEPGEQELVIIRGQSPDSEGASMPMPRHQPAAVGPSDNQDGTQQTGNARYYPIPTSDTTMPLLDEQDLDQEREHPSDGGRTRNSNDDDDTNDDMSLQDISRTGGSTSNDTDTNIQSQSQSPTLISAASLGPAPPLPPAYFEVTADDNVPFSSQTYYPPSSRYSMLSSSTSTFSTSVPLLGHNASSTSMVPEAAHVGANRGNNRNRQSGFRTFLNRVSMSMPIVGGPGSSSHVRSVSSNSNMSTASFFHRPGSSLSSVSHSVTTHQNHHTRQNPSISQSRSSLLSSPSTISINSLNISAPLTHTASRTQFTFPQLKSATMTTTTTTSGGVVMMTPDQVRVIAAREAIGRFGLPYGPDAVAFAAAKVGPPPPGFEEVVREAEGSVSRFDALEVRGGGHGARDETSASASSTSTATEMVRIHQTPPQSQRDSILKPKLNEPSTSSSLYTDGISSSPSPPTSPSTPTPTPASLSEFGQIPAPNTTSSKTQQLLSPDVLRSGSISSNYSSQTYATAAESLSVPLTTTNSNSTSRSSSYSVVGVGGVDVVRGWSSSEEGGEDAEGEGRVVVDERGSVMSRIVGSGLGGRGRGRGVEVEV